MEKNMKKRPHDFLWRGSQMESKLMPGKEVINESYVKGVSDKKQENTLGIVGVEPKR